MAVFSGAERHKSHYPHLLQFEPAAYRVRLLGGAIKPSIIAAVTATSAVALLHAQTLTIPERAVASAPAPLVFTIWSELISATPNKLMTAADLGCLVPQCGGGTIDATTKETPWDKYFTEAPQPRTPSEWQYSDRKLRLRR